jgi:transcriptional regulatory protein LevR
MREATPAPPARTVEAIFEERLDLLEEADQITPLARRLTEFLVAELATEFELELDEDSGAPMVTHIAMALTRLNRGEVAAPVSESLEKELAGRVTERAAVSRLMQEAARVLGREVPETEISYMTLHLTSLVLKR